MATTFPWLPMAPSSRKLHSRFVVNQSSFERVLSHRGGSSAGTVVASIITLIIAGYSTSPVSHLELFQVLGLIFGVQRRRLGDANGPFQAHETCCASHHASTTRHDTAQRVWLRSKKLLCQRNRTRSKHDGATHERERLYRNDLAT